MKRILLSIIMAFCALLSRAEVYTGTCGKNVSYNLDTETGLLRIEGTGDMDDYGSWLQTTPWNNQKDLITNIDIAYGVTRIGSEAFSVSPNLMSVHIPNSVKSIGYCSFMGCSCLSALNIPESVEVIEKGGFSGCYVCKDNYINHSSVNYDDITIVDVEQGDGLMIKDCTAIKCRPWATSITIPNYVTSIGNSAFYNRSALTSVTIGNSVNTIGNYAFEECSGLTSIDIPNSVTNIDNFAFSRCSSLTHLTLGNSVSRIGSSAFRDCTGLTSVIIGNSVTYIGNEAFYCCSGLKSVTMGNSVTSIGNIAFTGCTALTSVTIGNSVASIGNYAFSNCSSLSTFTCDAVTPPTMGNSVFDKVPLSSGTLFVDDRSIDAYKSADQWKNWGSISSLGMIRSISFEEKDVQIMLGITKQLQMNIEPEDATNKNLQWISTNTAVATVDAKGVVSTVSLGTTTIMAFASDGSGKSAMCNVTVVPFVYIVNDTASHFSVAERKTWETLSYTRTYNGQWEALYVPFSIDVKAICGDYEIAEINNIDQLDENHDNVPDYTLLQIKLMTSDQTEPNTPYLIRAKVAGEQTITLTKATIHKTEENTFDCSSFSTRYDFKGSYSTKNIAGSYIIQNGELQQTDGAVSPFRWYMIATSRKEKVYLPAKIRIMTIEDVIDGVEGKRVNSHQPSDIYNLSGQRITSMQKGLNIVGGRKVLK